MSTLSMLTADAKICQALTGVIGRVSHGLMVVAALQTRQRLVQQVKHSMVGVPTPELHGCTSLLLWSILLVVNVAEHRKQ